MRAVLLALTLVLPLATAGCLETITGPEAPTEYTPPPNPTFAARVVDGAGAGVATAQVCVGATETEATSASSECRSTRADGTATVTWPCESECPSDRYIGAVWRDPETGKLRTSAETVKARTPPTSEVVLYIIR